VPEPILAEQMASSAVASEEQAASIASTLENPQALSETESATASKMIAPKISSSVAPPAALAQTSSSSHAQARMKGPA